MSSERTARARGGFSLLEVSIGVLLIALGLVPLLSVIHYGVQGTETAHHLSRSLQLARSVIAVADALTFDELTESRLAEAVRRIPVPPGVEAPRLDPILIHRAPSAATGSTLRAKVVTVRVAWRPFEGQDVEDVVLRTLVVEPP